MLTSCLMTDSWRCHSTAPPLDCNTCYSHLYADFQQNVFAEIKKCEQLHFMNSQLTEQAPQLLWPCAIGMCLP